VLAVRQRQRLLAGCVVRVADRHGTPTAFGCEGQVSGGVVLWEEAEGPKKIFAPYRGRADSAGINQRSYVTF